MLCEGLLVIMSLADSCLRAACVPAAAASRRGLQRVAVVCHASTGEGWPVRKGGRRSRCLRHQ